MATQSGGAPDGESILNLLEHFKDDDGRVALLIKELQELSNRAQVAELATVDPRALSRATGSGPHGGAGQSSGAQGSSGPPGREHPRGIDAFAAAVRRVRHQIPGSSASANPGSGTGDGSGEGGGGAGGGAEGGGTSASGGRGPGGAGLRVEEATLPVPPDDPFAPLPTPAGGHEWEALQAAVNDSVAVFGAAAAKMGWKKWALTRAHSALLVSLFWWVVAAAFRADHPLSGPVQRAAFGHFCRHYAAVVLRLRGKARDQYQQVWIEMMAAAALYLLAEVYPRSQHKFDDGLRALVSKQLRLWTAGALPADMHPSAHADAHDASPAAFSVAAQAAAAAAADAGATRAQQAAKAAAAAQAAASASGVAPSLPSFSGPSLTQLGPGLGGPFTRGHMRQSLGSTSRRGGTVGGATASGGMPGSAGSHGPYGTDAGPYGNSYGPQGFVITKNSPVMAAMLAGGGGAVAAGSEYGGLHGGGAAAGVGAPPVIKGLLKNSVGGTLARLHRALDEGSDEELSYGRLAAAATASAADAVAQYDASRRAAAAEAAALRRGLLGARGAIEARQRAALGASGGAVKQMSDRLSGYVQNDVDRLLAGKPTSTAPGEAAEEPRYRRPTVARGGGGPGDVGGAPAIKPARLMAPLSELRRVEGNIRSALAGGRQSSTDTAAHAAAVTAAREAAAAADWRPLAAYPVGTKDTRRRKMAAAVLAGLDLEQYAV
ncbi:hypothetical protein HYH03_017567 [Edaphochlamys debaryana]|uniref:Uncharacterized protein n=1 Tax=Edaphochlamys debaryana TaxID=47281 RepID=A0A835XM91_9CHLO|nr:hypothetical protein HYH03_017567 [Edaphochlamys debaryana]|eukprot:KAG2483560.1 hypothetical protein HYH03_017567 [Edaphochlamys debaryana]